MALFIVKTRMDNRSNFEALSMAHRPCSYKALSVAHRLLMTKQQRDL